MDSRVFRYVHHRGSCDTPGTTESGNANDWTWLLLQAVKAPRTLDRFLTQSRKLLTYFFSFGQLGPSQHSLKLLLGKGLGKTLAAVSSTRVGLPFSLFSKPKHQPTTNTGSAPWLGRRPARASQHSLRLLQETGFGQTLAAVGSTPAVLLLSLLSQPGAHGLAADLATGGPTGPPGI